MSTYRKYCDQMQKNKSSLLKKKEMNLSDFEKQLDINMEYSSRCHAAKPNQGMHCLSSNSGHIRQRK